MIDFYPSVKYEIVVGIEEGYFKVGGVDRYISHQDQFNDINESWIKYAKEYFGKTGIYVSSIAMEGRALYNKEWGCPDNGERVVSFNCTANPAFIKAKDLKTYEKGIFYITGKLKKEFKQHTITITKLESDVCYLTDEENEELEMVE